MFASDYCIPDPEDDDLEEAGGQEERQVPEECAPQGECAGDDIEEEEPVSCGADGAWPVRVRRRGLLRYSDLPICYQRWHGVKQSMDEYDGSLVAVLFFGVFHARTHAAWR